MSNKFVLVITDPLRSGYFTGSWDENVTQDINKAKEFNSLNEINKVVTPLFAAIDEAIVRGAVQFKMVEIRIEKIN